MAYASYSDPYENLYSIMHWRRKKVFPLAKKMWILVLSTQTFTPHSYIFLSYLIETIIHWPFSVLELSIASILAGFPSSYLVVWYSIHYDCNYSDGYSLHILDVTSICSFNSIQFNLFLHQTWQGKVLGWRLQSQATLSAPLPSYIELGSNGN